MTDTISTLAAPVPITLRQRLLFIAPWHLAAGLFRLAYGFHVEGAEHAPRQGPFILAISEHSLIAMLVSGWIALVQFEEAFRRTPGNVVAYMQEELFALGFFRKAFSEKSAGKYAALVPHSAGRLAFNLLDGYKALQAGGIISLNPEGDMPWDGRPLPIRHALAWLALHTAAPIVPALCSPGAYDIWPRWQLLPSRRGNLVLHIGKPFKLTETPRAQVSERELEECSQFLAQQFIELRYGPKGIAGWMGAPRKNGVVLTAPVKIAHVSVPLPANFKRLPMLKQGIAQVLWRCPICRTDDALFHKRPWFRTPTVECQVCGTRWKIQRVIGKDFRLQVIDGAPDLIGLEMSLAAWYDEMKKGFMLVPQKQADTPVAPGEHVYLQADGVKLLPYRPNALFETWDAREPPKTQLPGRHAMADWQSIGEGRLTLTNERMLWQSPQRELDFQWSSISSLTIWLINTLGVRYGTAPYRFDLGTENGLKWMTYAGTLAQRAAEKAGRKIQLSPF
jgi:1-acyl-sn-glycerol-3-phosphate acyltransferase